MTRHEVEIQLSGAKLSPEAVSISALVGVLTRLDNAVRGYLPEAPGGASEEAALSLTGIRAGSETLVLSLAEPYLPAWVGISDAIESGDYGKLPGPSYEEIYRLSEDTAKRKWAVEIRENAALGVKPARLSPDKPLKAPAGPVAIKGTTTIHGRCLRVGGSTRPRAEVRLSSTGQLLNADISEKDAKSLAQQLYEEVALEGTATWDPDTWEIVAFKVTDVLPYRKVDPALAFKELSEVAEGKWDEVDPVAYVRGLRDEE